MNLSPNQAGAGVHSFEVNAHWWSRYVATLCAFVLASILAQAQPFTDNVGIGTATPDQSALLELSSNDKGFLISRLTQTERNAITLPATGLMIFNSTTNSFQYNIGTPVAPIWVSFLYIDIDGGSSSGNFWSLFGNDSIDRTIHYLGTNNPEPLIIKTDLTTRAVFTETGELEITTRTSIDGLLNLLGDTTSLMMDSDPGISGAPLVSRGAGTTPEWYTGLILEDESIQINTILQVNDSAKFAILPVFPLQFGSILVGDTNNIATPLTPGLEGSLFQIVNGTPRWLTPDQANFWSLEGNSGVAVTAFLGTTDANDLRIATDGTLRATFTAAGGFDIVVPTSVDGGLTLTGATSPLILDADAGVPGQILVSNGPGATPRYTDTLSLSRLEVTGTSLFRDTATFELLPVFPLDKNYLLLGDSTNTASPFPPGNDSTFLAIFNGEVLWFDLGLLLRNTAWIVGGNNGAASPIIGNLDTAGIRDLDVYAGGQSLMFLDGTEYDIDVRGPINLDGDAVEFRLNGDPGTVGQVLISQGAGATPRYTDSLTLSRLEVTGESFFRDTAHFDLFPNIPLQFGDLIVGDTNDRAIPMSPGLEGSVLQVFNGTPIWISPDEANYWSLQGNTGVAPTDFIGTNDANDFRIATDGSLRATFTAVGTFDIAVPTSIVGGLTLAGPSTPLVLDTDPGLAGQVLVSQGPGLTPRYTDSLSLLYLEVNGPSLFIDTATFNVLPKFPLDENFILVGNDQNIATPFLPGADSTFLAIIDGDVTWYDLKILLRNRAWLVGGNDTVSSSILGVRDPLSPILDLDLWANGESFLLLDAANQSINAKKSFSLDGANVELRLDGNAGLPGQLLVSNGPGLTPRYTDSLSLSYLEVTGESFFRDTAHFDVFMDFPLTFGDMIVGDTADKASILQPGLEGSALQIFNGTPVWISPDEASFWALTGNVGVTATDFLGTTDLNDLRIATDGTLRATFTGAGTFDIVAPTSIANSLTLVGQTSPLVLDATAGLPGQVLVSQGPGATPKYTDSLSLNYLELNGPSIFNDTATFNILPNLPLADQHLYVGTPEGWARPLAPGADSSFLGIIGGQVSWVDFSGLLSQEAWLVGGNDTATSAILGVTDPLAPIQDLDLYANSESFLFLDGAGQNINAKKTFNLDGADIEFRLNSDPGIAGQVMISQGPGITPRYTDSLTLSYLEVTGESFFRDTAHFDLFMDFPLPFGHMIVGDTADKANLLQPGLEGSALQIFNGTPVWITADQSNFWGLQGNTGIAPTDFIGTNDANDFRIATDGTLRATMTAGGLFDIAVPTNVTGAFTLVGPASPLVLDADAGTAGFVLISQGPGVTPQYTDSLRLRTITIEGESFFNDTATFNILPKMPLDLNYILVGNSLNLAEPKAPGSENSFLGIQGGNVEWVDLSDLLALDAWKVGGNDTVLSPILGINDPAAPILDVDLYAAGESFVLLDGTNQTIEIRKNMNLADVDVELRLNGDPGTAGHVLVSQGPGLTPRYTDSLTLSYLEVTGESFFRDTAHFDLFMDFPLPYGHLIVGDSADKAAVLQPGLEGSALQIFNGTPVWITADQSNFWGLQGNTGIAPTDFIGTNDANDFRIATNSALAVTIAAATQNVTVTTLSGAPINVPLVGDEGIVVADAAGTISKRDKSAIFALLGIQAGRYVNNTAATEFTVVINLPAGYTLDPVASITITPEVTSSVSAQPFIVAGSRTATTFSIGFPGGLDPGEAINYHVQNPF